MIVIIIVNWNGIDDTLECLESLLHLQENDFRILIIDNGSHVSPVAALEQWVAAGLKTPPVHQIWKTDLAGPRTRDVTFKNITAHDKWDSSTLVTLVDVGWNSGFAHANNVGMKMALEHEAVRQFWILNNDTIVRPDTLTELVKTAASDPDYVMIGSTLIYYCHDNVVQGIGARLKLLTARTEQVANQEHYNQFAFDCREQPRLDYVIGASMFLKRDFVEAVGVMDEQFFLYFEEIDWARRRRVNDKLGWSRRSIVYHKEGGSIGTDSLKKTSPLSVFYAIRGLPLFYSKWHPYLLPIVGVKIIFTIGRFLLKGDMCRAKAAWRGAISGVSALLDPPENSGTQNRPPHL